MLGHVTGTQAKTEAAHADTVTGNEMAALPRKQQTCVGTIGVTVHEQENASPHAITKQRRETSRTVVNRGR